MGSGAKRKAIMEEQFVIEAQNVKKFTRGLQKPIVLLDDDDAQIRLVETCYKMSKRENQLICFSQPDEFLKYMNGVLDGVNKKPELVLLDINMPQKDGFEILESIRSYNEFSEVPIVIMFTASESLQDKTKSKKLGADGFFSKPTSFQDYISFFQNI
ncbi:MAG: hypothetical protein CME62_00345 [Halobacteriovoraceae bacterium]|nr:hypothetical protein [Halobacteriovoraceae bacterium]|tara:strand:- start:2836 stop:3306 length:471 start_codon:yes stop_codon:yes gene_type:complete